MASKIFLTCLGSKYCCSQHSSFPVDHKEFHDSSTQDTSLSQCFGSLLLPLRFVAAVWVKKLDSGITIGVVPMVERKVEAVVMAVLVGTLVPWD